MKLTVVVPAHNAASVIVECLSALKQAANADTEIIVVDDASSDETFLLAQQAGVKVLQLQTNSGPAAARNYGARHARGDIITFVDADVVVAPDVLARVQKAFTTQPSISAVFGSYDDHPRATGTVSQYRNLLHHYVHQNGSPDAFTFWAGCGAIRKEAFESVGGFDEKQFARPSIEDIELGYRLRRSGHKILLDKQIQVTHLKRWTMLSFIKTDIMCRAIPWSHLILGSKTLPNDLNLKWDQRVSFALVALALFFLGLAAFFTHFVILSGALLLGVLAINRRIYLFFYRQRGLFFALSCFPLHLLYYFYSGFSYLYVWFLSTLRSDSAS